MAALTVSQISAAGLTFPSLATNGGAAGDTFANTGKEFIEIRTAGTAATVTFVTPNTVGGLAIADQAVVMPATGTTLCGPFAPGLYNDSSGNVGITYNGTAGVTLGVFRLPV
jgi:hypothetical protein